MENNLISAAEYARLHNIDPGNLRRYLAQGRVQGFKIGKQWVISKDAQPPKDSRIKSGEYIGWRENNKKQKQQG